EQIKKLRREGNVGGASRQTAALAEQLRGEPAIQASNRISSVLDQLDSSRQLQSAQQRQTVDLLGSVDKSRRLPNDDIEFPRDWADRTKLRGKRSQLTQKEKAILQALDSPLTVKFENTPLKDVIEYIETRIGQPIIVDIAALKAAEIPYDSSITINAR